MPRVKKQRKPRPLLRSAPPHPPDLKGREIGLYYRSLQVKKNNAEEKPWIHLRIPHNVIVGIYNCLQKIDKIARAKNIYLVPVKKLNFCATPRNADFIPIKATHTDKVTHSINNIHKRDDDVLFVKNKEPEAIEISDSNSDSIVDITENIDAPENTAATSVSDNDVVFISNNYTCGPSTSAAHSTFSHKNKTSASGDYKYGYDDIITGTFQEKLEECLSKGIKITTKTPEVDELNDTLKEEHLQKRIKNDQYKKMMEFRETLPTYKKAKEVLDIINKNQVIVISGETGCGKSTQIPQLILDEAVVNGSGANIKILVTEPRRIAASSLAFRVAEERGERPGTSVGYAVRLEATQCRERGSIMFCTTGVLLVELEQNQALSSYSHIILDEVHERDCQIDLTMCMLREVLKKRKDLKLILMSATIDADSLSNYYDKCPMIHIEGLAYPVKAVYMEEILAATKFQLPKMPDHLRNPKHWHKFIKKNRAPLAGAEKNFQYKATVGPWLSTIKKDLDPIVFQQLQDFRIEEINFQLIIELLKYISQNQPGAILVFLPGFNDISKLMRLMHQSEAFPSFSHEIHPLHSKLSTAVQNKIFKRPPGNIRKIVLATNVAETSITIDDVVYVVDCGKMKHKGLNVERNLSTLQVEWISKANMRQRRGRAGRCQPGICYHLITSYRAENLADRLPPELQRSNLLEEVLCIKKLRLGRAEDALHMMPAVPAEKTVQAAVKHLQQIGALDEWETLTPLGWHLARLPVHPAAGKLLLLGALFGCLDRAASVAAVWGFKEPFQLVIGKEKLVNQAKRDFALGEPSDHIAISEALIQWEQLTCPIKKRQFAYETFLSHNTMRLLSEMKRQFADHLKQMGFLRKVDIHSKWENRNMDNMSLFKALIAAALYPNIATVKWRNLDNRNPHKPMSINAFTPEDGKVALHPSSVMYSQVYRRDSHPICTNAGANWLVYWLKQKSTQLYLLEVTCVYTLPLMFFGDLNFAEAESADECFISISTQKVCCKKETADLLFRLRSLLDQVLTSKITHSSDYQSRRNFEFDEEVLNAVKDLITAEDEGTQYVGDDDDEDDYNCGAAPSNGSLRWGN